MLLELLHDSLHWYLLFDSVIVKFDLLMVDRFCELVVLFCTCCLFGLDCFLFCCALEVLGASDFLFCLI